MQMAEMLPLPVFNKEIFQSMKDTLKLAVTKSSAEPEPNPAEILFYCLFRHVLGTFIRSLQPFRDWLHLCRGEHSYIKKMAIAEERVKSFLIAITAPHRTRPPYLTFIIFYCQCLVKAPLKNIINDFYDKYK